MPELAVKIKMAPSNNKMTISGMSHHFFSCLVNLKNSLSSDHMRCCEFRSCRTADKRNYVAFFHGLYLHEILLRLGVIRAELNRRYKFALRLVKPALFRKQHAIIKMRLRAAWIQPRRLAKFISGGVQLIGGIQFAAQFKIYFPV
jgi:hypothetical protein